MNNVGIGWIGESVWLGWFLYATLMDFARVCDLLPSADDAADFTVEFRLTDDDVLRDASITGPFYPDGGDVTYELVVEPSDESVDITAP